MGQLINPKRTAPIYTSFNVAADATDPTKLLAFNLSGFTAGTTRTIVWPDSSGTVALTSDISSPPFVDTTAIVKGSANATRQLRFEVDGISDNTTRVLTPPNANATIAGLEVAQTFTAQQTFQSPLGIAAAVYKGAVGAVPADNVMEWWPPGGTGPQAWIDSLLYLTISRIFSTEGITFTGLASSLLFPGSSGVVRNASNGSLDFNQQNFTGATFSFNVADPGTIGIVVKGATSQSATLMQLKGQSSTTAREMANIDAVWATATDATRKARYVVSVWDTAAREGLRIESDGSTALTAIGGGAVTAGVALTVYGNITIDHNSPIFYLSNDGGVANDYPVIKWNASAGAQGLQFYSDSTLIAKFQDNGACLFSSLGTIGGVGIGNYFINRDGNRAKVSLGTAGEPAVTMTSDNGAISYTTMSSAKCSIATAIGSTIQGAASQTAPLQQLQGISSTAAVREMANVDAVWADNTDATRKARLVFSAWDTAAREGMRIEASGSAPMVGFLGAAAVVRQANASQAAISAVIDPNAKLALQAMYDLLVAYGLAPATA